MLKSVRLGIGTAEPDVGDSAMLPPGMHLAGLELRNCHGPCPAEPGPYDTTDQHHMYLLNLQIVKKVHFTIQKFVASCTPGLMLSQQIVQYLSSSFTAQRLHRQPAETSLLPHAHPSKTLV